MSCRPKPDAGPVWTSHAPVPMGADPAVPSACDRWRRTQRRRMEGHHPPLRVHFFGPDLGDHRLHAYLAAILAAQPGAVDLPAVHHGGVAADLNDTK